MNQKKAGQHIDDTTDNETLLIYEKGRTKRVFGFATISRWESGKRYIILRLPIRPWDDRTDILARLLRATAKKYKIKKIFIDRYFFASKALQLLQRLHLKYVIPCPQIGRIQKIFRMMPTPCVIKDFQLNEATCNLIIAKCKENKGRIAKRIYATNEETEGKKVRSFGQFISHDSAQWEISVNYEPVKHSKMTSLNRKLISSTFCA